MKLLACGLAAFSLLVSVTPARAQERALRAHLEWQTPLGAGCVPQRQLERDVEALLDRPVFVPRRDADRVVSGVMVRRGERWSAQLELASAAGESLGARELHGAGPTCASVNAALVVVLATLIDTPLPSRHTRTPGLDLGLGAALGTGTLPSAAFGVTLSVAIVPALSWPTLRVALSGWLPQHLNLNGGGVAVFRAAQGSVGLCPELRGGDRVRLSACAGLELGFIQGSGLGLAPGRAPSRLLLGLPVETGLSFQLFDHLALRLSGALSVALERPRFYVEASDGSERAVHRVGMWAGALRLSFIATQL